MQDAVKHWEPRLKRGRVLHRFASLGSHNKSCCSHIIVYILQGLGFIVPCSCTNDNVSESECVNWLKPVRYVLYPRFTAACIDLVAWPIPVQLRKIRSDGNSWDDAFHRNVLRSFLGIHDQVMQEVVSHFGQSLLLTIAICYWSKIWHRHRHFMKF